MIYVHRVPQRDAADRVGQLVEAASDTLEQRVWRPTWRPGVQAILTLSGCAHCGWV